MDSTANLCFESERERKRESEWFSIYFISIATSLWNAKIRWNPIDLFNKFQYHFNHSLWCTDTWLEFYFNVRIHTVKWKSDFLIIMNIYVWVKMLILVRIIFACSSDVLDFGKIPNSQYNNRNVKQLVGWSIFGEIFKPLSTHEKINFNSIYSRHPNDKVQLINFNIRA